MLLYLVPNARGLLPRRYRPHQPQPVGDPPVLWSAPSHLSTSTAAEPCSKLQRNPTALVQLLPVDKQISDPSTLWTVATPGLCSHKTHTTDQPFPNHHLLCGQPIGLDTVHIVWRTDAVCPHTVQTSQKNNPSISTWGKDGPLGTLEDLGFIGGKARSRDPKRLWLYQRPKWIKRPKVLKTPVETPLWTWRLTSN